ncbi:KPN_02809 family neutral zinc metallopeptidase [Streptococcus parasanguinis]|uniref:KPN_02809 family neutral zinc metallopeptidase n=1 Tax=Streptococcus parasanguinis TaxID=1318 RepID=UPI0012BB85FD|nr:neutral zinc metallopeptidase [Streptococcus parasanguinis]MCP8989737.1 zinc metallopeptidase [Streptococcus parasanguinis]MCP8991718.1 zinc metallopeptidase [Streptococcus parasanguinis]MCP9003300.1 zinc metallopeptidase [Streptococcus parasanguinis]MCP9008787.1 zinc metallopeptidase [Streptococcus parasanguinis]MCP9033551.1 zinc metallopeptidase [Streptococcus parasanguinis]
MKSDNLKESRNIEDRRGQSYSQSSGNSNLGGGILQILLSPGSFKSKIILILLLVLLGGGGASLGGLFGNGTSSQPYQSTQITRTNKTHVDDADAEFVSKVLATTEDHWHKVFQAEGRTYQEPKLVFYTGRTQTGCGVGQASAGPFYCPTDKKIYLDMSFYKELTTKYKASGDFAMAYVIAHEVGHHVQNELGILGKYHRMQQGLSEKERNAISVRIELQADYLAGVWARSIQDRNLLDIGDIEEAMNAAHAVGDDTLQEQAYGYSVPDSFTHGTSEQRMRWFKRGYQYGDLQHGDTFSLSDSEL